MSCLNPRRHFRLKDGGVASSEKKLQDPTNPPIGQFYVPCGSCGWCRISRARNWATRCVHEASYWKQSCFITLTYKTPPPNNSLCPDDTRNFIRRFRDYFKKPFKYFLAGEYGENFDRPHYHALIFGYDFGLSNYKNIVDPLSTKTNFDKSTSNLSVLHDTDALECPELNDLWGLGYTSVGALTFDSAAYTAQYACKKVNGAKAKDHYKGRHPEFMRTSQDAIGKQYALKYAEEIISNNSILSNGQELSIPPYYLKLYEKEKLDLTELKRQREDFSSTHSLEKSYNLACKLDAKYKGKTSIKDKLLKRKLTELYHNDFKNWD